MDVLERTSVQTAHRNYLVLAVLNVYAALLSVIDVIFSAAPWRDNSATDSEQKIPQQQERV